MATVDQLAGQIGNSLAEYCSPTSGYAWPWYDVDDEPDELRPLDLLAPALLSYPIPRRYVQEMLKRSGSQYSMLFDAMAAVVADEDCRSLKFEDLSGPEEIAQRSNTGWGLVLQALDMAQDCKGLTSVAVTKILHRKRPYLVPISDSLVKQFYCGGKGGFLELFNCIWVDLTDNEVVLDRARAPYIAGNRQMTRLRCLDIAVWMHMQ